MAKRYLFATYTDYESGKLTGGHRRFMELLSAAAKEADVVYVGRPTGSIKLPSNVTCYPIDVNNSKLPKHIAGSIAVYRALKKNRKDLLCDYAISFNPVISICYYFAGIKHIVSLFRENLIGYHKALKASRMRLMYFQLQERLAVRVSEKIIIQCKNDKDSLVERNRKQCKNIDDKVIVQINNTNASWMGIAYSKIKDLKPDKKEPMILFIGNFSDSRKGHAILLPAVKRLLDEGYRFEFYCAGDGKELSFWKKECSKRPDIHFLGRINNVKDYLACADMVLVPSLIDSCPNTALEGLNAGVAVYGANTGGIPDILQKEEYMFAPNENDIYEFLREVLNSKRYSEDAIRQREIKEQLTFDWGHKILELIDS